MDVVKIGSFIKTLRKEKALTQEQFAEQFHVSRRTVSRWETGANLPDLDILLEIADYCNVELKELLDGERKSEKMDRELEQTVLQVAQYSNEDKIKLTKRIHVIFIAGLIAEIMHVITNSAQLHNLSGSFIQGFCGGAALGTLIFGVVMTSKYAKKIKAYKMRLLKGEKDHNKR